jgi:hypothetical protein
VKEDFRFLDFDAEYRVGVNVRVNLVKNIDAMRRDLEGLGMDVVFVAPEQHLVIGYLPPEKLTELPGLANFTTVTPIMRPMTRAGSVQSQGDRLMLADSFRVVEGVDGTGITVGVISDSVDRLDSNLDGIAGIRESQPTGDLPRGSGVARRHTLRLGRGSGHARDHLRHGPGEPGLCYRWVRPAGDGKQHPPSPPGRVATDCG